ncbi:MAG: spinster family MFS transporter [Alphaproteobacteria bacterium]
MNQSPSSASTDGAAATEPPWPNIRYAWFVVFILYIASIFSFLDRQIISLMVEDIKIDLGLTDFQIGLVQGLPFGLFYALMSIPIALAADRYSRRNIIVIGVTFWSLATAACGLASSFWHLFLARVGVGSGEATLSPSAYSMISDYFPKSKLALAMAVFTMGNLTGVGLAMILGGEVIAYAKSLGSLEFPLVGELRPWQFSFIVIGLPGVLLALCVFAIREPIRRGRAPAGAGDKGHAEGTSLRAFFAFAASHKLTFASLFGSFTLLVLVAYGNFGWVPTFLIRTYGLTEVQAGASYGTVVLLFGTSGAFFGGWLSSWLAKRGHGDAPYRATMLCSIPTAPLALMAFVFSPNEDWSIALLAPLQFVGAVPAGLAATAMMTITPNQMRAKIGSAYLFFSNAIGLSLGATTVGFLTTYVFEDPLQIGSSLAIVNCIGAPLAVVLIWLGMKPFRASLREVEAATTG